MSIAQAFPTMERPSSRWLLLGSLALNLFFVGIAIAMTGLVGRMFREFALTLTIAVVASAIGSLTLTPMMCARLLRHVPGTGSARRWATKRRPVSVHALERGYR